MKLSNRQIYRRVPSMVFFGGLALAWLGVAAGDDLTPEQQATIAIDAEIIVMDVLTLTESPREASVGNLYQVDGHLSRKDAIIYQPGPNEILLGRPASREYQDPTNPNNLVFIVIFAVLDTSQPGTHVEVKSVIVDEFGAVVRPAATISSFGTQNGTVHGASQGSTTQRGAEPTFIIVTDSREVIGTDTENESIHAQRTLSDGTPVGAIFQVNSYTTGRQIAPRVATGSNGDFVVVWRSTGSSGTDSSNTAILGQRYSSDGTAAGGEFQVNQHTLGYQVAPDVARRGDGSFLVVWESGTFSDPGPDGDRAAIAARLYGSDGNPTTAEFVVNTYTTHNQQDPVVAWSDDQTFVVAWMSYGSITGNDTVASSIAAQQIDAGGSLTGSEFQVNSYTSGYQSAPSIGGIPFGGFVIAWQNGNGVGGSVMSRTYRSADFIFADGFGEGDTSTWSSAVR